VVVATVLAGLGAIAREFNLHGQDALGRAGSSGDLDLSVRSAAAAPAAVANKEFFTEEEIAALDKERGALKRRDARAPRGSVADVAGAYNSVFNNFYPTGRRTSLIVDPPDGRIPPFTPAALERMNITRKVPPGDKVYEWCRKQRLDTGPLPTAPR
jgi:hypothetical protein